MSVFPEDYTRLVLEDIEEHQASRKPRKASLFERFFINRLSPMKIHANPQDEFSIQSVGPNFGIVSDYQKKIVYNIKFHLPIFEDPIIIEKIEPEGYMLLNGHHRWFAAIRTHTKKIRVQITNLTHEEDLKQMIEQSSNSLCVAFDLDEVLLAGNAFSAEPVNNRIKEKVVKARLRLGAPELIRELQKKGYDVWVYTADYRSIETIKAIFNIYGVMVDGIVNATARKKSPDESVIHRSRELIHQKYDQILHIDNVAVVCTHAKMHSFDDIPLDADADQWAKSVLNVVDSLHY